MAPAPSVVAPAEQPSVDIAAQPTDVPPETSVPISSVPPVQSAADDDAQDASAVAATQSARNFVAEDAQADEAQPAFPRFAPERAVPPEPAAVYIEPSLLPSQTDDEAPTQSRFAHEPPFSQRRNPAKIWTLVAIIFALMVAAAGTAISYFGMPNIGLANVGAEPDLTIVLNENLELNEREDGTPYFIASGSIVNPTGVKQSVPEMLVTLKDASGRPVYSWKMKAKARSIGPGGKIDFSEARLDVPLAAREISVGWVLPGG
jgi:hypothetical protein